MNGKLIVKVINKSNNPLPEYATEGSAGLDLKAWIEDDSTIVIKPGERRLIKTGLHIELPIGYEARIQPRSGLALKNGISIVNSPGLIDPDFRGDIGVILINHGDTDFEVRNGDRIAQMVISKFERIEWKEESLSETQRGEGGFGHTGN